MVFSGTRKRHPVKAIESEIEGSIMSRLLISINTQRLRHGLTDRVKVFIVAHTPPGTHPHSAIETLELDVARGWSIRLLYSVTQHHILVLFPCSSLSLSFKRCGQHHLTPVCPSSITGGAGVWQGWEWRGQQRKD